MDRRRELALQKHKQKTKDHIEKVQEGRVWYGYDYTNTCVWYKCTLSDVLCGVRRPGPTQEHIFFFASFRFWWSGVNGEAIQTCKPHLCASHLLALLLHAVSFSINVHFWLAFLLFVRNDTLDLTTRHLAATQLQGVSPSLQCSCCCPVLGLDISDGMQARTSRILFWLKYTWIYMLIVEMTATI